jgi:hypothetical protein
MQKTSVFNDYLSITTTQLVQYCEKTNDENIPAIIEILIQEFEALILQSRTISKNDDCSKQA